jgi:hypothetical protein
LRYLSFVRGEIHLDFLIATDHHDILHNAGHRFSCNCREFETMTVQMDRMNVVAGVPHANTVALALPEMISRCHQIACKHGIINSAVDFAKRA